LVAQKEVAAGAEAAVELDPKIMSEGGIELVTSFLETLFLEGRCIGFSILHRYFYKQDPKKENYKEV
jgi:hypothetical protein